MMTLGCAPYVAPDMAPHFRHNAVFIGANVREAINDGRADSICTASRSASAPNRSSRSRTPSFAKGSTNTARRLSGCIRERPMWLLDESEFAGYAPPTELLSLRQLSAG